MPIDLLHLKWKMHGQINLYWVMWRKTMIKKAIVAIVVIVAAAAIVFAATGNTNSPNSVNSINQEQQNLSANNDTPVNNASDNSSEAKISSAEAKKIAQKYIEEPGATAGTPSLTKIDGNYVYIVPVIDNGKNVGEINIDPATGKNVGGAGGAP